MFSKTLHPARSVRAKFFFLHLSILAPFVIVGIIWIGSSALEERSRLVGQLEKRAERVVAALSAIAQEEATAIRTMGEFPALEQEDALETTVVLSLMLGHHPPINDFYVIDAGGMRIASAVRRFGEEEYMGESELFQTVMRSGLPFVGKARVALVGRAAGQPVVPFAVPLRDHSGKQIGLLVGEVILSEIGGLVTLGPEPSGGYVYVVDRAGQVVAHPSANVVQSLRDFSGVPIVHKFLQEEEEEGTAEFFDPTRNTQMIGVYKRITPTGWGVISESPASAVSSTIAQRAFGSLVIIGIALTFALVSVYFVGNRMANRIINLASAAQAVGSGEVGRRVEVAAQDEMGTLASSLNVISERLDTQQASLEGVSQNLKRTCEDVATALASGMDIDEAIRLAMTSAARLAGAEAAMGLVAENGDSLRVVKTLGAIPRRAIGHIWPIHDERSPLARAVRERQPQQVQDVLNSDVPLDPVVAVGREAGFRAALLVPMDSYGRSLGALVLFDTLQPREFPREDVVRVQAIAGEAAVAIENSRLHRQVRETNERCMLSGLRLRTIIETIPEGVLVAEAPEGRITMANSAAERLLGREVLPEIDLHEQPSVYGLYKAEGKLYEVRDLPLYRAVVLGEVHTQEIIVKRPNGDEITVLFSGAPLRSGEGSLVGGVGIFRDISEMKELDRLKDELITITSHELKSPLTVIKGYAQLLQRKVHEYPEHEEPEKWLKTLTDQSNRLAVLVERLLDVSRIQTGRLELTLAPVDIVALTREVAEHEQVTTTLHQIQVFAEMQALVGNWDSARLEQVLINLIDNAIKYSPQGGPIDIIVRQVDHEALVSIEDHGLGISKDDQKRIFERFYRARTGRGRPSGLGLGLYVSCQIVNLHGGRMWVESEVGKGSTFYFALPLNLPGLS